MKNLPVLSAAAIAALLPAAAVADDPEPRLVSKQSIATMHRSNGNVNNDAFGGGAGMGWFFDGNLGNGVYIGPNGRTDNGSYVLLDFTKDSSMPEGGWYVTSIDISEVARYNYSLYHSTDGSHWTAVENGVGVSKVGTASYGVNEVAKYVKVVFDVVGGWNQSVSEIQVYGVDPADLGCRHPAQYLTEWTPIPGTANCTEKGIDRRECTNCGASFTRESETLPALGHEYVATLDEPGSGLHFGSGTISCVRHDLEIDCTEGPVDLNEYGDIALEGREQFTNVSVSSTGQTEYGVSPHHLIDDNWTMSWNKYWFPASQSSAEYAQWTFGTPVDLTSVDFSLPNRDQTIRFYSVLDDGSEILVGEFGIETDPTLPTSGDNAFQRTTVEFRGVALQTLRVRVDCPGKTVQISELHPYGTVAGAGKSAAVRTRIIFD